MCTVCMPLQELFAASHKPTATHYFMRLLHEKRLLLRVFTQNIDSLESVAGLPKDMIVAAHGNCDGETRHVHSIKLICPEVLCGHFARGCRVGPELARHKVTLF